MDFTCSTYGIISRLYRGQHSKFYMDNKTQHSRFYATDSVGCTEARVHGAILDYIQPKFSSNGTVHKPMFCSSNSDLSKLFFQRATYLAKARCTACADFK